MSVTKIKSMHDLAKANYDGGGAPAEQLRRVSEEAIQQLATRATSRHIDNIGAKNYSVFTANNRLSRPFLSSLYIEDIEVFNDLWGSFTQSLDGTAHTSSMNAGDINRLLYSSITAFSICYDLWNPGARKTPGTFYEVLVGSVLGLLLPNYTRTKFISIPNEIESVSTDIVFTKPGVAGGLELVL
jgi:hypothetical protein